MKTAIAIAAAMLLCAGCAGGGDTGAPTSSDAGATAGAAADGGCAHATVDGSTQEAEVQRLATDIYGSLDCGTDTALDDQLAAVAKSAKSQLRAAGIRSHLTSAAGGSALNLSRGSGGCQIMVVDSIESESLTCLDL